MIPFGPHGLAVLALALGQEEPRALELHDHAALQAAMQALATEHPGRVQRFTIAESRAGRAIDGLRLGSGEEPPPGRPAILLVAGLDGPRAYTSSLALHHAERLAEDYGNDESVTALLDSTTVYVLPRFDVDACEARFESPLAEVEGTGRGVDDDRDGRAGEDGPSDVNGDGNVTSMRRVAPDGEWIEDAADPRAMVRADRSAGQRGRWELLTEGLDSDGDEEVAEDPLHDAVANRNFPRDWREHSPASGRYPTDEPGALGLVEFLLAHPDVALVLCYGDEGNLVKKPASQPDAGAKRGDVKTGVYESDLPFLETLGERYRELTENDTEGLGEQPGSFQAFAYHHRGLWTLSIDPWSVPLDAEPPEEAAEEETEEEADEKQASEEAEPAPEPGDDAKRLIWLDQHREGAFLPWAAFDHPQLGPVEIGGFAPYVLVEPPAALLPELAAEHFQFLLSLGADLPRLELVEVEGVALGDGLVEVTAVLENDALLPQMTRAARLARSQRPARVRLELSGGAELAGGSPQQLVDDLEGSGGRLELRWLVSGVGESATLRVAFDTDNAGAASVAVEVER